MPVEPFSSVFDPFGSSVVRVLRQPSTRRLAAAKRQAKIATFWGINQISIKKNLWMSRKYQNSSSSTVNLAVLNCNDLTEKIAFNCSVLTENFAQIWRFTTKVYLTKNVAFLINFCMIWMIWQWHKGQTLEKKARKVQNWSEVNAQILANLFCYLKIGFFYALNKKLELITNIKSLHCHV